MFWILGVLIFMISYGFTHAAQLPNDIPKCRFGNNTCIRDSINYLIRQYPKGIPQMNLAPFDLNLFDMPHVGGLWMTFRIRNQWIGGCENATVLEVNGFEKDPTKGQLELKIQIPRLAHKSDYDMQLRWLSVVRGNTTGKCLADFQNVRLTIKLKVIMKYHKDKRYLKIYELLPHVELDRFILSLTDLYKENSDLTQAVNIAYNKNWLEIWNDVEPNILPSYSKLGTQLLDNIFNAVPYDDMFLT